MRHIAGKQLRGSSGTNSVLSPGTSLQQLGCRFTSCMKPLLHPFTTPAPMQPTPSRHTASAATPSPRSAAPSPSAAAPSPSAAKPLLLVVGIALLRPAATGSHGGGGPSGDDGGGSAGPAGAAASVLLAQRPPGKANAGLWEFPGGKVEAGETPEQAQEELGIKVEERDLWPLSFASHSYPGFHLLMPLYGCTHWSGEPVGAEGQAVVWASEVQVLAGAEQRGTESGSDAGASSWFPLTAADVPLVPDVVRALRQCSQQV